MLKYEGCSAMAKEMCLCAKELTSHRLNPCMVIKGDENKRCVCVCVCVCVRACVRGAPRVLCHCLCVRARSLLCVCARSLSLACARL